MKILVWGTGKYARAVYEHASYINSFYAETIYEIIGYIDNNIEKQNIEFLGKKIYGPENFPDDYDSIVIGVYEDSAIIRQIEEQEEHIVGKFCTFFDFVYRDIYLEKKMIGTVPMELKDKIDCQLKYLNNEDINSSEYAGTLFSIYSKNIDRVSNRMGNEDGQNKSSNIKTVALYYIRYSNGGVERVISHHVNMFLKKNYNVILFLDEIDKERDYILPKGVKCIKLTGAEESNYFVWMKQIYNCLEEYKVDVLISHRSYWEGNYYLNVIARQLGFRFFVEIHNVFRAFALENIGFFVNLYKNTDGVVCLSETDRKFWNVLGVKAWFIPNPIENINVLNKEKTISKRVLWIGRIENKQKRFMDVLDVAIAVNKIDSQIKFVIVGDFENDNFRQKVIKKIKKHRLEKIVMFEGYKTNLSAYYENADCLLLTSEYEGFPMVIAEAYSHNLPVITYSLPYLDMYKYHKGYVEVPHGDTEKMSKAIITLLKDGDALHKLSLEQEYVLSQYKKISLIGLWEEVFRGDEEIFQEFDECICDNIEKLLIEGYTNERI